MSKRDFEFQNSQFRLSANVEIGFGKSEQPILTQCECQNRISNVKIAYFHSLKMSKQDLEFQNSLFRLSANVGIGFGKSEQPILTQCDCQNRISNIKIAYFDQVQMSRCDFECQHSIF